MVLSQRVYIEAGTAQLVPDELRYPVKPRKHVSIIIKAPSFPVQHAEDKLNQLAFLSWENYLGKSEGKIRKYMWIRKRQKRWVALWIVLPCYLDQKEEISRNNSCFVFFTLHRCVINLEGAVSNEIEGSLSRIKQLSFPKVYILHTQ